MADSIAKVLFAWNATGTRCKAEGFDARGRSLGDVVVELSASTLQSIRATQGESAARRRIEQHAEAALRTMLAMAASDRP